MRCGSDSIRTRPMRAISAPAVSERPRAQIPRSRAGALKSAASCFNASGGPTADIVPRAIGSLTTPEKQFGESSLKSDSGGSGSPHPRNRHVELGR